MTDQGAVLLAGRLANKLLRVVATRLFRTGNRFFVRSLAASGLMKKRECLQRLVWCHLPDAHSGAVSRNPCRPRTGRDAGTLR